MPSSIPGELADEAALRRALGAIAISELELFSAGRHAVIDGEVVTVALRAEAERIATAGGWEVTNRLRVPGADALLFRTRSLDLVARVDGTVAVCTRSDDHAICAFHPAHLHRSSLEAGALVLHGTFAEAAALVIHPRTGWAPTELPDLELELRSRYG